MDCNMIGQTLISPIQLRLELSIDIVRIGSDLSWDETMGKGLVQSSPDFSYDEPINVGKVLSQTGPVPT